MTVHFIGAGPGAADLITVRGRDLIARCPVCLYAGSIVPAELLQYCPPGARIVDTAPMSLDEIELEFAAAHREGKDVARLHSGDLSVWSAVAEQIRRLQGAGIPYTLTPGVPSFAAAAAALGRELTIPTVAQSLVLTRVSGRASEMPAGETLAAFGRTGATLAIHLAIHALPQVVAELMPLYGADCPVAIVVPYTQLLEAYDYDIKPPEPAPLPLDEISYQKALGLLADRRKRIGIYAGMGCADATASLIAVAEMLQAPVATSVSGKGAIPDAHPLAVGWGYGTYGTRTAENAFENVDVVLAVGVRYSEVSTAGYAVPAIKKTIHVDANPENLGRNIAADVLVHADARVFLDRMLVDRPALQRPVNQHLINHIKCWRDQDFTANAKIWVKDAVDPMFFLVQLRQAMFPNDLILVDVTASTHWASEAIDVPGPRRYFTPADNQSMGWALPAAIGAQKVRPDVRVACVTGRSSRGVPRELKLARPPSLVPAATENMKTKR